VGDQPRLAGPWLPISYAVGGRQNIAVSTGNSLVSSGLNTLAPELHPSNASNIFVFALPETN
jgi:hypothetical protein